MGNAAEEEEVVEIPELGLEKGLVVGAGVVPLGYIELTRRKE